MGFEDFNISKQNIEDLSNSNNSDIFSGLKSNITNKIADPEFRREALLEVEQMKKDIFENKDTIINGSGIVLKDLKSELIEDLNSLNYLEDKYSEVEGFDIFKKILLSSSASEKEYIYDLVESGEFDKYINRRLRGKLFPDIESIKTFLEKSIKKGKIETSQNGEIEEIKNLKINDLTSKELIYFKNKINDLLSISKLKDTYTLENKYDEITEKIEKTEEKEVKIEEKEVKIEEKIEKEKAELFIIKANEFISGIDVDSETPILKNIVERLSEKLEGFELNYENIKNIIFLQKEITKYLLQGNNLHNILKEAKSKGEKEYNKVNNFLKLLSNNSDVLKLKLSNIEQDNSLFNDLNYSSVYNKQLEIFLSNNEYDKEIDFKEQPPKVYMVSENGYKIEMDLPDLSTEEMIDSRRELQKAKLDKKSILKTIGFKTRILNNLKLKPNITEKEQEQITTLELEIKELNNKKDKINQKIKDLNNVISDFQIGDKQKRTLEEKEKKIRKMNKFLSSIGFDLIPQSITDQVIETLNSNNALRSQLGFNEEINIAEGSLGLQKDNDRNEIGIKEKVIFAEFVNIMISGNKNGPINVEVIRGGTGVGISDRTEFQTTLKDSGVNDINGNVVIMQNLENFVNEGKL